ncbi:hypothetical protein AOXY_G29624 [Acipenser oxyrinchus oxyrinchus]|uniref:PID domain-containing protein n=1 Tax=Acipenser oxyrinchus oxyrinchus TaxID=40147 RepID=A0AAD8CMJ5_ACIOX|nr:hypothetical protein AOXY_G29624 [Acipenser oxyrinchus oxyrinchus]
MAHLMRTLRDSPAALRRRFTRDRTESLSHGDPLFKVHYLGTEKIYSLQAEQAEEAIGRLLQGAPAGKLPKDHALVVRPRYVEVKEISTGRQLTKTYLRDIACCAAGATRPDVFLYICRSHGGQQLQCRVFWCSKEKRVRQLTGCLAQSFQRALSDWQESSANEGEESQGTEGAGLPGGTPPAEGRASTLPANLDRVRSLEKEGSQLQESFESEGEEGVDWGGVNRGSGGRSELPGGD